MKENGQHNRQPWMGEALQPTSFCAKLAPPAESTKGKAKMQLRSRKTKILFTLLMGTTLGWLSAHAQNLTEPADKYQWLEDVSGERSMAWVNAENERSAKALNVGPVYTALAETALKVLESPTRLPSPQFP